MGMDPPLHLVCAAVCNYFPCSLEEDEVSERKQEASARQAQVRYRGPFLSSAYPWHSARQSKIVWICEAVGLPGPSTSSVTRLDSGFVPPGSHHSATKRGGRSCVAPGRAGPRTAAAEHIRTSSHRARYGNPHRSGERSLPPDGIAASRRPCTTKAGTPEARRRSPACRFIWLAARARRYTTCTGAPCLTLVLAWDGIERFVVHRHAGKGGVVP
jgi:hypothetical protein